MRCVRNSTAPAGAALFLTKPLGLGIVSTAIKRGLADDDLVAAAVGTDDDDEPGGGRGDAERGRRGGHRRHRVRPARPPAPDARGIRCGGRARRRRDPADGLPGPRARSRGTWFPVGRSGTSRRSARTRTSATLPEPEQIILADAQTSGGLLIAAEAQAVDGGRLARPRRAVREDRHGRGRRAGPDHGRRRSPRVAGGTGPAPRPLSCGRRRRGRAERSTPLAGRCLSRRCAPATRDRRVRRTLPTRSGSHRGTPRCHRAARAGRAGSDRRIHAVAIGATDGTSSPPSSRPRRRGTRTATAPSSPGRRPYGAPARSSRSRRTPRTGTARRPRQPLGGRSRRRSAVAARRQPS